MASLAQKLWDQLGAPLDLVDKGKYGPEKGFKWNFVEPVKNFAGSNDQCFWQKSKEKDLADLFNQGLQSDHICQPDDNYRCKQCGKILKWIVYGSNKITEPHDIFYYDFNYIVLDKRQSDEIITFNYMELNNLIQQREFTFYTLCRTVGMGYCDFSVLKKAIPKQIAQLKFTGDKFHSEFEFYGDFESSNLKTMVIDKKAENCKIVLKSDSNSLGFAQWFYYGVKYWGSKPHKVKFSIVNQKKKHSLFSKGMKFYVGQFDPSTGLTWEQFTSDIAYKQSDFRRKKIEDEMGNDGPKSEFFNKLEFDYTFKNSGDRVLFSYYKPYTFSDLIEYLEKIECNMKQKEECLEDFQTRTRTTQITTENIFYKKEIIGGTKLGLSLFMLEITSPKKTKYAIPYKKRKVILILGRQHPFESPSSLVCEGIINFLISDNPIATQLKNIFIFKIAPMVNPDGVVIGNSRTNLTGFDLNRCWENPSETLQPEIFFIKEHINKFLEKKRDIFIFLDLHASASKTNAFLVGCEQAHGLTSNYNWVSNRLITKIMQESMCYFREKKCKFNVRQKNQCTARVVLWKEFKAQYSFNFEFSMHGYKLNEYYMGQGKMEEKAKIKSNVQERQINQEQFEEQIDKLSISNSSEESIFIQQSQTENINEIQTKNQISQNINLPVNINSTQSIRKFSNQNNDEKKIKVPTQQFTLEDFEKMGEDICHNLLKFTMMTSMMKQEIERSNATDLDISKIKEKRTDGDQQKEYQDKNSSFSSKVQEIDQTNQKTQKKIGTPLHRLSSFSLPANKKSPSTNKNIKLTRQDSTLSQKSHKQSVTSIKEIPLPTPQSPVNNQTMPTTSNTKSNFFSKLQNRMKIRRKRSQSISSDCESDISVTYSIQNNQSDSQGQMGNSLKLNLNKLQKIQKMSIDLQLSDERQRQMSKQGFLTDRDNQTIEQNITDQGQPSSKNHINIVQEENISSSYYNFDKDTPSNIKNQKKLQKLQNLTNPPMLNLSNQDILSPSNHKPSFVAQQSNSQGFEGSPLNSYGLANLNKLQNQSLTKQQQSINSPSMSKQKMSKKGKSKSTMFVKYIIAQFNHIKNLFPEMRSFNWVDYFLFEEIEAQFGEKGVADKLIMMMNDMGTILEYDTDSDPEDDLIDPTIYLQNINNVNFEQGDHGERQNKTKEILSKFGENFKGKIQGQNIDDLQSLAEDAAEFDENGKPVRRKEPKSTKNAEVGTESQNIWTQFVKNRQRQDSIVSNKSNKTNKQTESNQDINEIAKKTNSNFSKCVNTSFYKQKQEPQNIYYENTNYKNNNNKNGIAKYQLPKLEVVKLKNPFLPSNKQLSESYKLTNITKALQQERERQFHQKMQENKKKSLITLTAFDTQRYEDEKLELDPFLCMAGSTFFSPSKTMQTKQITSPLTMHRVSSQKILLSSNQSWFLNKNLSHSNSSSQINSSYKNSMTNLPQSRKESEQTQTRIHTDVDYPINTQNSNKDNINQDFIKEQNMTKYKILNSQFGSLILPKSKEIDQQRNKQSQQSQTAKKLVIYQSRLNKDPYQLKQQNIHQQKQIEQPYYIQTEESNVREDSKKTVLSYYRKKNRNNLAMRLNTDTYSNKVI